jgi:hypothetical protein
MTTIKLKAEEFEELVTYAKEHCHNEAGLSIDAESIESWDRKKESYNKLLAILNYEEDEFTIKIVP